MAVTLETMLKRFGFVTVMNPSFYTITVDEDGAETIGATAEFTIDSLRISNITQEGPTKTAKGGLYATTQMRYGKTMRLEMEDVVGRIDVLVNLMGAKVEGEKLVITDKFASAMRIVGETFVIDSATGEKNWAQITIYNFLPDSTFEQTMESEGDFGAMNIAGEIQPNKCGEFYEISVGTAPTCPTVV